MLSQCCPCVVILSFTSSYVTVLYLVTCHVCTRFTDCQPTVKFTTAKLRLNESLKNKLVIRDEEVRSSTLYIAPILLKLRSSDYQRGKNMGTGRRTNENTNGVSQIMHHESSFRPASSAPKEPSTDCSCGDIRWPRLCSLRTTASSPTYLHLICWWPH